MNKLLNITTKYLQHLKQTLIFSLPLRFNNPSAETDDTISIILLLIPSKFLYSKNTITTSLKILCH